MARVLIPSVIIMIIFRDFNIRDALLISLLVDHVRMTVGSQMDHISSARALSNLSDASTVMATNLSRLVELVSTRVFHVSEKGENTES